MVADEIADSVGGCFIDANGQAAFNTGSQVQNGQGTCQGPNSQACICVNAPPIPPNEACGMVFFDTFRNRCGAWFQALAGFLPSGVLTAVGTHPQFAKCSHHPVCAEELENLRLVDPDMALQVETLGCCPMNIELDWASNLPMTEVERTLHITLDPAMYAARASVNESLRIGLSIGGSIPQISGRIPYMSCCKQEVQNPVVREMTGALGIYADSHIVLIVILLLVASVHWYIRRLPEEHRVQKHVVAPVKFLLTSLREKELTFAWAFLKAVLGLLYLPIFILIHVPYKIADGMLALSDIRQDCNDTDAANDLKALIAKKGKEEDRALDIVAVPLSSTAPGLRRLSSFYKYLVMPLWVIFAQFVYVLWVPAMNETLAPLLEAGAWTPGYLSSSSSEFGARRLTSGPSYGSGYGNPAGLYPGYPGAIPTTNSLVFLWTMVIVFVLMLVLEGAIRMMSKCFRFIAVFQWTALRSMMAAVVITFSWCLVLAIPAVFMVVAFFLLVTVPVVWLLLRPFWMENTAAATQVEGALSGTVKALQQYVALKKLIKVSWHIGTVAFATLQSYARFLLDVLLVQRSLLAFTIMLEMPRLEAFLISIPISLVNFELPGIKLQVLWPVVALLDFLESILTSLTSATSPSATCVFIAPLMTLMGMAVSMPLLVILLASDFLGIVATSQVVARENKKHFSANAIVGIRFLIVTFMQLASNYSARGIATAFRSLSGIGPTALESLLEGLGLCNLDDSSLLPHWIQMTLFLVSVLSVVQLWLTVNGNFLAQDWAYRVMEPLLGLSSASRTTVNVEITEAQWEEIKQVNPGSPDPHLKLDDARFTAGGHWGNLSKKIEDGAILKLVNGNDVGLIYSNATSYQEQLEALKPHFTEGSQKFTFEIDKPGMLSELDKLEEPISIGTRTAKFCVTSLPVEPKSCFLIDGRSLVIDIGDQPSCPWKVVNVEKLGCEDISSAIDAVKRAKEELNKEGQGDEKKVKSQLCKDLQPLLQAEGGKQLRDLLQQHGYVEKNIAAFFVLSLMASVMVILPYLCISALFSLVQVTSQSDLYLAPYMEPALALVAFFTLMYVVFVARCAWTCRLCRAPGFGCRVNTHFLDQLLERMDLLCKPIEGKSSEEIAKMDPEELLKFIQKHYEEKRLIMTVESQAVPTLAVLPTLFGVWSKKVNGLAYKVEERTEQYCEILRCQENKGFCRKIREGIKHAMVNTISISFMAIPGGAVVGKCVEYLNMPDIFRMHSTESTERRLSAGKEVQCTLEFGKEQDRKNLLHSLRARRSIQGQPYAVFANGCLGGVGSEIRSGLRLQRIEVEGEKALVEIETLQQVEERLKECSEAKFIFSAEKIFSVDGNWAKCGRWASSLFKVVMAVSFIFGMDTKILTAALSAVFGSTFLTELLDHIFSDDDEDEESAESPEVGDTCDAMKEQLLQCSAKQLKKFLKTALMKVGVEAEPAGKASETVGKFMEKPERFEDMTNILRGEARPRATLELAAAVCKPMLGCLLTKLGVSEELAQRIAELAAERLGQLANNYNDSDTMEDGWQDKAKELVSTLMIKSTCGPNPRDVVMELCNLLKLKVNDFARSLVKSRLAALTRQRTSESELAKGLLEGVCVISDTDDEEKALQTLENCLSLDVWQNLFYLRYLLLDGCLRAHLDEEACVKTLLDRLDESNKLDVSSAMKKNLQEDGLDWNVNLLKEIFQLLDLPLSTEFEETLSKNMPRGEVIDEDRDHLAELFRQLFRPAATLLASQAQGKGKKAREDDDAEAREDGDAEEQAAANMESVAVEIQSQVDALAE
eukprot:TRINITY_DN1691_c0_g1_i2.p1 TRINITY_DN1691_c0_g1~~TRINITY_DN1691_c0_g1_i2.p1  ORF type:complete len:2019 (+),score=346.52 TRINITY_DN1691_c0_g1_i2:683-6058(+)